MFKTLSCALVVLLGALSLATSAAAQGTPAPQATAAASKSVLVLIPYQEPGSTDPHAVAISKTLETALTTAGVVVKSLAPIDRLSAVANAAAICTANDASGLLIPEGRYEQTMKRLTLGLFITLLKYPTHAEFRLDDVGCNGVVRWSTTTVGDADPSGVDSVGNLGAAVDQSFNTAILAAVRKYASATIPVQSAVMPPVAAPTPSPLAQSDLTQPSVATNYLLVPFGQPGIADPRAADITHSLLMQLQQHHLNVTVGSRLDHLTAVADAPQLCASSGAQDIIVPNVRIEQSSFSGRSHASMRLAMLSCTGNVLGEASSSADMGSGFIVNFGAAVVGVSERAMGPAIDKLFPVTKPTTSGS